jgi:hypothetical protein
VEKRLYSHEDKRIMLEVGGGITLGLGMIALSLCSFTYEQKRWIKERDDYSCQVPEGDHGGILHVHHIVPEKLCDFQGIEPDTPMNASTICDNHHHTIHKAGNKTFETKKGRVVWGDQWLTELSSKAVENTRLAFVRGRIFPKTNT